MNILYIAYSCDPYNGTEDKIGWNIPVNNLDGNRIFVITKEESRKGIERFQKSKKLDNIQFYYVDVPTFCKRIFKGFLYSIRMSFWCKKASLVVKEICSSQKIDIVHQITPVEFRCIVNFSRIKNEKFIVGPVGGAEYVPSELKKYSKSNLHIELVRKIANYRALLKSKIKGTFNKIDFLMCANQETRNFLKKGSVFTEIGLDEDERVQKQISIENKIVFIYAGRFIYRKGLDFLLDTVDQLPEGLNVEFKLLGNGPDFDKIKNRIEHSKKLQSYITLKGKIPFETMKQEYNSSHIFVMPSIRETTGSVILEAFAHSMPVIAYNGFGAREIIDERTGWLYSGDTEDEAKRSLHKIIQTIIFNPSVVTTRGKAAFLRSEDFTWTKKVFYYNKIYKDVLERHV